jgi:hypothetical protein
MNIENETKKKKKNKRRRKRNQSEFLMAFQNREHLCTVGRRRRSAQV